MNTWFIRVVPNAVAGDLIHCTLARCVASGILASQVAYVVRVLSFLGFLDDSEKHPVILDCAYLMDFHQSKAGTPIRERLFLIPFVTAVTFHEHNPSPFK